MQIKSDMEKSVSETDRAYQVMHWARGQIEVSARRFHDSNPQAAKALRQVAEDLWLRRAEVVPCAFAATWLQLRLGLRSRVFGPYSSSEKELLDPLLEFVLGHMGKDGEQLWARMSPDLAIDAVPRGMQRDCRISRGVRVGPNVKPSPRKTQGTSS